MAPRDEPCLQPVCVFVLVSPAADPEARFQVQVLYLGGDPKQHQSGGAGKGEGMEPISVLPASLGTRQGLVCRPQSWASERSRTTGLRFWEGVAVPPPASYQRGK